MQELDRRALVRNTGAVLTAGAVAGSTGGDYGGCGGSSDVAQRIDDYLSRASNYDGTISDQTGEGEVTIEVVQG